MNVDDKVMALAEATGYPVAPGLYMGSSDKYIVYTTEDERPDLYADDDDQTEEAVIQVQFICPYNFDYHNVKRIIKRTMKMQGFTLESLREIINTDPAKGTKEGRSLVFSFNIMMEEEEE